VALGHMAGTDSVMPRNARGRYWPYCTDQREQHAAVYENCNHLQRLPGSKEVPGGLTNNTDTVRTQNHIGTGTIL
jgi:hypothetical protein